MALNVYLWTLLVLYLMAIASNLSDNNKTPSTFVAIILGFVLIVWDVLLLVWQYYPE